MVFLNLNCYIILSYKNFLTVILYIPIYLYIITAHFATTTVILGRQLEFHENFLKTFNNLFFLKKVEHTD